MIEIATKMRAIIKEKSLNFTPGPQLSHCIESSKAIKIPIKDYFLITQFVL